MYKVMVVDDESMVRLGIMKSINWDNYGIEAVLEAQNGREALEILKHTQVQIVITDVKMPIMDGIELIQELRSSNSRIKIIVVSGYSDYAYLKEAIQLNVSSYILKPINDQELNGTIASCVVALEKETICSMIARQGQDLLKQNTLFRLIEGNIEKRELKEKASQLDISIQSGPYQVCVLHILQGNKTNEEDIIQYAVANIINELMSQDSQGISFEYQKNAIIILFTKEDLEESKNKIFQQMREILHRRKMKVEIGMGDIVAEVEEITYSFHTACGQIRNLNEREQKQYCKLVKDLLVYIGQHFKEEVTLKEIADLFYVNPSYLGYLFKKEYGISFIECVNRYRMNFAKEKLETTHLKVYEIAELVGFKETRYFARLFKNYFGQKPSDIRK